jgi:hypothetical protein
MGEIPRLSREKSQAGFGVLARLGGKFTEGVVGFSGELRGLWPKETMLSALLEHSRQS